MEFGIDKLMCWQTLVFGTGVYIVVFVLRRTVEFSVPSLTVGTSKLRRTWDQLVLPLLPIAVGIVMAALISKTFLYPEGLDKLWGRVLFGMICGFGSAKIYQVVWGVLKSPDARAETTP